MATTKGQKELLGQGNASDRRTDRTSATKSDESEAPGYDNDSAGMWKIYGAESEKYDRALMKSWKGNTDSMLNFTGLFSLIVTSFLIETSKTLTPDSGSRYPASSAIRVNVLMFLSLFFSVTCALVTNLIQKWTAEYLQYSQPSAAPHTRGRVRAYLFDGLSKFQMRRLTDSVPVLLHLAIFFFLYALSEWLHSINVHVGTTAHYCLVTLLTVYIALSILPLIVLNAPYQTALTSLLRACLSLVHISYIVIRRLVRLSSPVHRIFSLFKSVHVDRARGLVTVIKKRPSEFDRSAMRWLLQELNEDDMDAFLGALPGYIHSNLTDAKLVVEGFREGGLSRRIRDRITVCVTSVGLTEDESLSRARAGVNSLRLIFDAAGDTAVEQQDDIRAILEYLDPLCFNSSTALRAMCIRDLVIRELLLPYIDLDAEEFLGKGERFPDYLIPLYQAIRVWKETEISQWPHLSGILTATNLNPPPTDLEMWTDIVYDGPLINLTILTFAVLSRVNEGDLDLDLLRKAIEIPSAGLGLSQLRASAKARAQFDEIILKVRGAVSGSEGGGVQITTLLKTLDIVTSGLHLAEVFACTPKPKLLPRHVWAMFGPMQLRDNKLLEVFAARLPGLISASTPEVSKSYMERLILEDKLWEQLHIVLLKCFDQNVPFPDRLKILVAFFDIFDVAFDVLLKDSEPTIMDWRSPELNLLFGDIMEFEGRIAYGNSVDKVINFRLALFRGQFCHALLSQFAMRHSRGEPLVTEFSNSLIRLVGLLGVGTQEDMDSLTIGARTGFDMMTKAGPILNLTLRDGPLSNFCILGRLSFDAMASDLSDMTSSDDTKKLWKTLGRMLDNAPAPFANSSEAAWAKFDHLCAIVRDPGLSMDNNRIVEKLQPLLDMVEKVGHMRPPGDGCDEGTGNEDNQTRSDGSVDGEKRQADEQLNTNGE